MFLVCVLFFHPFNFLRRKYIIFLNRLLNNLLEERKEHAILSIFTEQNATETFFFISDYPLKIPIRHYEFDICNKLELEYALSSCTTIFHCAAKPFEFVYSEENPIDQYWHDNVNGDVFIVHRNIPLL